jgi:hypothetical protein
MIYDWERRFVIFCNLQIKTPVALVYAEFINHITEEKWMIIPR